MDKNVRQIMVVLSICYGVVIAALAMLDVEPLGPIAAIGAMVLGAAWGISSILTREKAGS